MTDKAQSIRPTNRIYFLDNLRTIIIFLVVVFHVGGVYESFGDWEEFWLVDDPDTSELSGLFNIILDIFMMPTLFFISGYLAPVSLKKRGGWKFVVSKFQRLMIPWLIAVFTLIPLYKAIFLYSRELPQERWSSYFHFSPDIINVGMAWLWFLPVLFAFTILYALLVPMKLVPTRMSFKRVLGIVFTLSFISSFSIDLLDAGGWTHLPVIDFQNERLFMYFLIFLLGTLAFHQQVFAAKPERPTLYRILKYTFWIPVLSYMVFLIRRSTAEDDGLDVSSVDQAGYWLSFYLVLISVLYLSIVFSWRHFDLPGKLWNELNRNSYGVYIIHVVVLGVLALPLLDVSVAGVVKYLILTALTYVICNGLVSLRRRIPQRQYTMYPFKKLWESPQQAER